MNFTHSQKSGHKSHHPTSQPQHRLHLHHCRHQIHRHQQLLQQQHQHSRSLSLLHLPRSPVTLVCLLIISSALTLPCCNALHSLSTNTDDKASLSRSGNSEKVPSTAHAIHSQSKRTILPLHFKLLQDYLHEHGAGSGVSEIKPHVRYPVEMLFPPGVLIAADSNRLWSRSRRSSPLDAFALSLSSKSFPHKMTQTEKDFSLVPFSPRDNALVKENFLYPDKASFDNYLSYHDKLDEQIRPSKFESKSLRSRAHPPKSRRNLKKIRQKQRIVEALRRRDKAEAAAAARKDKIASNLLLPTLSESLTQAFKELESEKAFVRKHKSKSHKNRVPTFESLEDKSIDLRGEYINDPFIMELDTEQASLKKATGQHDDLFAKVEDLEPRKTMRELDWFSSSPIEADASPLLSSPALKNELPSAPIEIQDTVVFDGDFKDSGDFSGLGGFYSGPVNGDSFLSSATDSFSHSGTFGEPVSFPDDKKPVKVSFGSGNKDGFGDFWGEGEFVADDKDCEDIDTKSCVSNLDCSCYGFYECSRNGQCVTLTANSHQSSAPNDVWGEAHPLGFGLSKRHAIQPGKADTKSESELDLADLKLNKPGSRRRR